MWQELLNEYLNLNLIVIIIGSMLGSVKANFNDKEDKPRYIKCFNVILGFFCGVSVAFHYQAELATWLVGLSALGSSMISITALDTIYTLAPALTKFLIKLKIGFK